ncbi:MAG: hypothetical protein KDA85_14415 [Planctomycetaceae bacterium]|nr:hypothetical protein [Planctomycetaceae bacterium]
MEDVTRVLSVFETVADNGWRIGKNRGMRRWTDPRNASPHYSWIADFAVRFEVTTQDG